MWVGVVWVVVYVECVECVVEWIDDWCVCVGEDVVCV